MKFTLTIECDNAPFEDSGFYPEISRILCDTGHRLMNGSLPAHDDTATLWLRDENGIKVGVAKFIHD